MGTPDLGDGANRSPLEFDTSRFLALSFKQARKGDRAVLGFSRFFEVRAAGLRSAVQPA